MNHLAENNADSPATDTIQIPVPEGLQDLAPKYLAFWRNELSGLAEDLAASDFENIEKLAHNLKGTGAAFGFEELTRLGAALENSAKHRDWSRAKENFSVLEEYLGKVRLTD